MSDSEHISSLCQEFCSGSTSQDVPRTLAGDIHSGKTDLLSIVEALGVYLTSTAVDNRCQGTRLLSEVLTHLHSHTLPQDDSELHNMLTKLGLIAFHYLALFYCDRLKDRVAVIPHVLRGLHAMVVNQKLLDEDVVIISRAIFSEVHNQSLPQGERRLVYTIMDYFLSDYTEAVKEMGSDFVLGYIQAVDGEKDPRNIVIAFNSVHRIVMHLSFEVLAEDLFDVTSCYFPINFTPPPDDPCAISKEQLVLGLRNCLTASPKFAEFCLPLMLEKVSSDLLSAKLDSLLTIAAGCETFGVKPLHTYLQALWMAIRKEIFQSVSKEVEEAGIQCLSALSKALSPSLLPGTSGGVGGGRELRELTEMVLKDCHRHLVDPDLRLLSPASHMLQAVAAGCDQACTAITSTVVPHLLEQFNSRSMVSQKKALLQVLLEFVNIVKKFSQENVMSPLAAHKSALISLVSSVIQGREKALVVAGLDLWCGILLLPGYLEPKEVELLAEHAMQLALSHDDVNVRKRASQSLESAALCYPRVTKDTVLPPLLQLFTLSLPMETDQDSHPSGNQESNSVSNVARLLASISTDLDIQTLTLPALMSLLEQLAGHPFTHELAELTRVTSNSIFRVVKKTVKTAEGVSLVCETVVERILMLCIAPTLASSPPTRHHFTDDGVVRNSLDLLRIFTLAANSDHKTLETWSSLIGKIFLENKSPPLPPSSSFLPLESSSPVPQTRLVSVLVYTIGAMTKEWVVCSSLTSHYLPRLLKQAVDCLDEVSSSQSAMCYASIINKTKSEDLELVLGRDMATLWHTITDCSTSDESRARSLTAWVWLTKALVVRSHPQGKRAALKLFDLFGDPHLNSLAAHSFSTLLQDTEEVLNIECRAIVRLMHKQQFFEEVVPELVKRFNQAPLGERQHFLRALSHIMQSVPKQVLMTELPSLLPLLLESLGSEDTALRQSTLEGLHPLIQDAPGVVSDHMPSLIPRLLLLATAPDSMKIRCSALSCLNALSKLPRHLVVPYQNQVIQALGPCLDDRKRLVRKEAVKSRSNWFVLDSLVAD